MNLKLTRKLFKKILSISILPVLKIYLKKTRYYTYEGIHLRIQPGVFHPGLFFSTKYLLYYCKNLPLKDKTFLELGAGSALLSFYANKQGALVTASDISEVVIKNIEFNQLKNKMQFEVVHSDLFERIPLKAFNYIIINPPYFKKSPKTEADYAWYCGEKLDYFTKLFSSVQKYTNSNSKVIMVLSEDCAIDEIKEIAGKQSLQLKEVLRKRIWLEQNFIFEITTGYSVA